MHPLVPLPCKGLQAWLPPDLPPITTTPSQLLAILGPSGAGKTSVLDVASGGLLARATGSVCINGEPLALSNIAAQV